MNSDHLNRPDDDPRAPAQLVDALKSLHRVRLVIPARVDEAVLARARAHFLRVFNRGSSSRSRPSLRAALAQARAYLAGFTPGPVPGRRLAPWMALAGALVLAAWLMDSLSQPAPTAHGRAAFAREDLNQDGQVNILDAFLLAWAIEAGQPLAAPLDLNGDGLVDERDVERLAQLAVKLDPHGGV
jgi:hypothetical protein